MNETKKMRSISRNISRSQIAGLFSAFLFFDILVTCMALCGWCYFQETAGGREFQLSTPRRFELAQEREIPKETKAAIEHTAWHSSLPFESALSRVRYFYEDETGKEHPVYAGRYLIFIWQCLLLLFAIQLLTLLFDMLGGAKKARRQLAPLYEMTKRAQELTDEAAFDEEKFHHLEDAISQISPTGPDARLHTGDSELLGLEQAVNSLLDRMRQSYQQQARFVSDASHELRTPIAVIQGYANLLDRWGKEDEQILEESIRAIKSESDHMKKLVEQLLFLARGDSGKTRLVMEKVSLGNLMKEVLDESVLIDPKHHYILKNEEDDLLITGDSSMIKQAARILVDNAAKYTPEGGDILLRTGRNEKGHSFFLVQDEGIGISPDDTPHIFERFFRSDPARSRESGGTGLGLSIAKWIIDRHGGYFQVLSREGIGTRITVCFPS